MRRIWVLTLFGLASLSQGAGAQDVPSEQERNETHAKLVARRNAMDAEYNQSLKDCYQQFDVNSCRLQARERRILANQALRKDELAYKATERRIRTAEAQQRLDEKNSEAKQKQAQAQRAQAIQDRQQRATELEKKQLDHALKGTQRGAYEERLRDAQAHRENLEKRLRERDKPPAAPLPVPAGADR